MQPSEDSIDFKRLSVSKTRKSTNKFSDRVKNLEN